MAKSRAEIEKAAKIEKGEAFSKKETARVKKYHIKTADLSEKAKKKKTKKKTKKAKHFVPLGKDKSRKMKPKKIDSTVESVLDSVKEKKN